MQNKDYSNRIGEESIATNGMKIKISEYFSSFVVFQVRTIPSKDQHPHFFARKKLPPKKSGGRYFQRN